VTEQNARPLGEWLQHRREELDISLEQAEADTRIRIRYLEALEAGDFDALPDPVVGRGFLRNYAAYLELDPEEIARYADSIAPPAPEPLPGKASSPADPDTFRPVVLHDMPSRISRQNWGLALLAILILAALGAAVYFGYPFITDLLARRESASSPTLVPTFTRQATSITLSTATHTATSAPSETGSAAPVETSAPTATAENELTPTLEVTITPTFTPSPSPSPSPPIYTGIFLEVVFTDTSWIQVTVDGVREFQGELEAGTYRSWFGEQRIELRVGNAGAVQVTVNGQFLGALGAVGEVVDRVFEKVDDEIIESTATPEVTGTLTVEPTAPPTEEPTIAPPTPTISPTLPVTPTATITPTLTITPTASP
jgi:cytoskeletal protein RodZ